MPAQAPDDDRVWLARAHLAIRLGDFEEARQWLDRCLARRPEDPAVWRMKLQWALACDRPEEVRTVLPHLPADEEPVDRVLSLRVWMAAHQHDRETQRRALKTWVELDPTNGVAREQLAELERADGHFREADAQRSSVRALDQLRKEYTRRLATTSPRSHANELARLASQLGRPFDADRWMELSGQKTPNASPSPRDPVVVPGPGPRTTLADLLSDIGSAENVDQAVASQRVLPRFIDYASQSGLAFVHENGGARARLIPPVTASGGVGLIDFDGDGWLDVYLVQGGPFPPRSRTSRTGDRLFHNRGNGTFEDATGPSGIGSMLGGYGHGVTVGDYDNDGRPDLFVTRWKSYALYRNRGDGTFEDVTAKAGLEGDRDWPTSAAFADLDGDGDLDLYVCHYMKWDENQTNTCADPNDPTIYRCLPLDFEALPDHLFRNDGGRFMDVTAEAGIVDRNGRGLGVLAADLDEDGRIDLFVANDMTANYWFRNLGGLRFEEVAQTAGVAANASGSYQAGMGVACGDLDGDGHLDLAVTNFYNEFDLVLPELWPGLFRRAGRGRGNRRSQPLRPRFRDRLCRCQQRRLARPDHRQWPRPRRPPPVPLDDADPTFSQRRSRQDDGRHQAVRPSVSGSTHGRGLAVGDIDNDGRPDVMVVSQNEPVVLFHNQTDGGHFLTFRLEGSPSNRDAVGALVSVHCEGRIRIVTSSRRRKLPVRWRSEVPFRTGCSPGKSIGLRCGGPRDASTTTPTSPSIRVTCSARVPPRSGPLAGWRSLQ